MKRSSIKSTGRYVPGRHVSNDDLAQLMDTSDEWIRQRTGIEARYWVEEGDDVGTSDLALEASKIALKRAGWSASDLDLIVFATMTSDVYVPGSGVILQHKLGAERVPALDIRQQCTGFLHGLELCDAYIMSGKAELQLKDIDMVIPHQANLRINEAFRERMQIPAEKIFNNIQQYGNTTGATIPIALDELMERAMLKSGDTVMFIGLGAGLTWGGLIYRLP